MLSLCRLIQRRCRVALKSAVWTLTNVILLARACEARVAMRRGCTSVRSLAEQYFAFTAFEFITYGSATGLSDVFDMLYGFFTNGFQPLRAIARTVVRQN